MALAFLGMLIEGSVGSDRIHIFSILPNYLNVLMIFFLSDSTETLPTNTVLFSLSKFCYTESCSFL